jgi:hypothetical protein
MRGGKEKSEKHERRGHSPGAESDASEMVWSSPRRGESDVMGEGQRSGIEKQERTLRLDVKEDESDVLGDLSPGGEVGSGRCLTTMEFASHPSEFIRFVEGFFCAEMMVIAKVWLRELRVDLGVHKVWPLQFGGLSYSKREF